MRAKDYRHLAWGKLSGNWGIAILSFILYGLIIGAASATAIGGLIVTGPLTVGYMGILLAIVRGGEGKIEGLFEGFTSCFVGSLLANILTAIFTFLWSLLLIVPGIIARYSYAMTNFILKDNPELSATEAISRSKEMMKGHKWALFCLEFSYIGWLLLSCLTFGILLFMVTPYMDAAKAAFYEDIKGASDTIDGTATETEAQ